MEAPRSRESPDRRPLPEIREIVEETTAWGEPGENTKNVAENTARYLVRRDSTSRPTGRANTLDDDGGSVTAEVILLRQKPAADRRETIAAASGRRVIELSDSDCKLGLRRQLEIVERGDVAAKPARRGDLENAEILRRLPLDTVVIRQSAARASSKTAAGDYRELTETNSSSGGSSSTSGRVAAAKVKRIRRAVRNKTRETVEVRRNPMRVTKKDKGFTRSRQRLLANSRREVCSSSYEPGKRARTSATPYMNTRSVTRKMYTVGATYQAPTRRDELEWKEWPVHGMHERPVYHPQVGLAVEYLGRYFTSVDGLSYCEIVDEPEEIEVVAVDPHCDRWPSSAAGRAKTKGKRSARSVKDAWGVRPSTESGSFETCMHGSLHCVLGYCSQVVTAPFYGRVGEEATRSTAPAAVTSHVVTESTKVTGLSGASTSADGPSAEDAKLLEGYAIAMAQSVQSKSSAPSSASATRRVVSSLAEARRSTAEMEGVRSINAASGRMNLAPPTLRGFSNASLVLLKNARTSGEALCKTKNAEDAFKPTKLEDGDDTLSSIYRKLLSANESTSSREGSPARSGFYALKRHLASTTPREYNAKKAILEDSQLENARTIRQVARKTKDENGNANDAKIKQSDGGMVATSAGKSRAWCTSETSEIARILSEYNRSTTRKSAIQIYGPASSSARAGFASTSAKGLAKATFLWQKDTTAEENRNGVSAERSVGLDLSQGKWRQIPTLEKIRGERVVERNARDGSSASCENRQPASRELKVNACALNYARERPPGAVARTDLDEEIIAIDAKVATPERSKDGPETVATARTEDSLQELLENTAILYCAANGVHQDDLSSYIDTLDSKQSIRWLENWNNSIV